MQIYIKIQIDQGSTITFKAQHTHKMTELKRWGMPSVGKGVKSLGLSRPAGRSVIWYNHSGSCKYQIPLNVCIPCDQESHALLCINQKRIHLFTKTHTPECNSQHY